MFWGGPEYNEGQEVIPREGGIGGIWISGYDFAHSINKLKDREIFGVLSAVDLSFKYPEEFQQLTFKLEDNQNQKVSHCFESAFDFIEKQRQRTNVLVHCAAGISRCSTILISYLMKKYNISYDEAYKKIKSKRSCIQPNSGFEKQLRSYEI